MTRFGFTSIHDFKMEVENFNSLGKKMTEHFK